jgi:hypothetical protein
MESDSKENAVPAQLRARANKPQILESGLRNFRTANAIYYLPTPRPTLHATSSLPLGNNKDKLWIGYRYFAT